MGVIPDHEQRHRKIRRPFHGHFSLDREMYHPHRHTLKSFSAQGAVAPETFARKRTEQSSTRHHMTRRKSNHRQTHLKADRTKHKAVSISQHRDDKTSTTKGSRIGTGALNNLSVRIGKESSQSVIPIGEPSNVSSSALEEILMSMPIVSRAPYGHGGIRLGDSNGDTVWMQDSAGFNAANKNKNQQNNASHKADPMAKLENASNSASFHPFRENPVFPANIGSDTGISESSLGIPASEHNLHNDLGARILLQSGSEGSAIPQPGLDHQSRCKTVCVEGSVCVHLKHSSTWKCICEGDFEPPHPETGCEPIPRGRFESCNFVV
ncbi:hypothetical protein ElyMa_006197200 [Elysia marginata]|uniref:EGF-like domain-containing protein n=1 Tax=Elysia marginata TaxID=1093978 RepID=A0AAV4H6N9_9GAST|nr:hypothetical protein ElyMa_006197200 [Elysia marginata]